ncbi:MAG: trypsin-like peptidase domain-containing protein [Halioglobus sp.]
MPIITHSFPIAATRTIAVLALVIAGQASHAQEHGPTTADSRQVYTETLSPVWLRAVGKLQVPGTKIVKGRRSHHWEDCSGTLVASPGNSHADTVITAWHCLEYYNDLSQRITFTLLPDSPDSVELEVYRLADGGSMNADWAILRLQQPIARTQIAAMPVHPREAKKDDNIIMAGYSSDEQLGRHGEKLTYDADCNITEHSRSGGGSNCYAHKGASGGAVVFLSNKGEAWFSGVISQGDGVGFSTYVPVTGFRNALSLHLR